MIPSRHPRSVAVWLLLALVPLMLGPAPALAADAGENDRDANAALTLLYQTTPAAVRLAPQVKAWEIGVGPSVVIVTEGMAKSLTTTTAKDDVYGFIYGQKGLMAGLGLQGSKITEIEP